MRSDILNLFKEKKENIGAFCGYLKSKNGLKHKEYINKVIHTELVDESMSIKLYYFINEIKEPLNCDCGKHRAYIGFKNGFRSTCGGKKCYVKKRKETCLDKYGVDNPKKSKEILEKEQVNIKERWNGEHYMKSKEVSDKFKSTMLKNHGFEFAQQSNDIKSKSLKTWYNNPNKEQIIIKRKENLLSKTNEEKKDIDDKKKSSIVENFGSYENFIDYRLDKIKQHSLEKHNTDHHFKSPEIIKKRIDSYINNKIKLVSDSLPQHINYIDRFHNDGLTDVKFNLMCDNCKDKFIINRQLLFFRLKDNEDPCLNCNPILHGVSKSEKEVLLFIEENYKGKIESNIRIDSMELDIYLPELNIGFEYNGLYWHSELYKDKKYHINKTKHFDDKNISVIHIWEDDWKFRKDIIKSIILNKLSLSSKIYARKCVIKEIKDNKIIREFLNNNHLQGFVGSKYKIGLYYNDELVSLMTFGSIRKSLGGKNKSGNFELLRFCNKINFSVVGGGSKLLKFFKSKNEYDSIISYCDLSRYDGKFYENLGFNLISKTEPNYYWIIDEQRKHRFNFRKDKLVSLGYDKNKTEVKIMNELGYQRIYDCGSLKYESKSI
jgi:hypothetical protein